jgi:hypothetical protein
LEPDAGDLIRYPLSPIAFIPLLCIAAEFLQNTRPLLVVTANEPLSDEFARIPIQTVVRPLWDPGSGRFAASTPAEAADGEADRWFEVGRQAQVHAGGHGEAGGVS